MSIETVLDYAHENQGQFLEELSQFLSFKSVSTDPEFKEDVTHCAYFLAKKLELLGFSNVNVTPTEGHPIVVGERITHRDKPTVLFYGHYDVQPADPYDQWESPPFSPTIRDNYIYARGASDDKGQVWCHLSALESFIETVGELPINVKVLFEGEEEIGSPHLEPFLHNYKDDLSADLVLISDTPMFSPTQPSICMSLRGMVYLELFALVSSHDLHSGQNGGVIYNPIELLASISSALKDDKNRITIPGFYDGIVSPPDYVTQQIQHFGFDETAYKRELGVSELVGEDGYHSLERRWFRPCSDVHGIVGGYVQPGAKTVIPNSASMKLSFRLVSGQDPEEIVKKFESWVSHLLPDSVNYHLEVHGLGNPIMVNVDHPLIKAGAEALKEEFHETPLFVGEGGSIPIVADFKEVLGVESLLMGFNNSNDNIHAPNERFGLDNFNSGVKTIIRFLEKCANA